VVVVVVVRVDPTRVLAPRPHSCPLRALCSRRRLAPMAMVDIHQVQAEEVVEERVEVVVAVAMRMHILDHTSIRRGREPNRVHRLLPV